MKNVCERRLCKANDAGKCKVEDNDCPDREAKLKYENLTFMPETWMDGIAAFKAFHPGSAEEVGSILYMKDEKRWSFFPGHELDIPLPLLKEIVDFMEQLPEVQS